MLSPAKTKQSQERVFIFEDFAKRYPKRVKNVAWYCLYGDMEIIIYGYDRTKVIYNYITKTLTTL